MLTSDKCIPVNAYLLSDIFYIVLLLIHFCRNLRNFLGKVILAQIFFVHTILLFACLGAANLVLMGWKYIRLVLIPRIIWPVKSKLSYYS